MFTILQNPSLRYRRNRLILTVALVLPFVILTSNASAKKKFQVEEATIAGIHRAIMTNQITCAGLVQAYIDRAAAYNGVCTKLVTEVGAPIPSATGYVRAGSPIVFPTETVPVSSLLPAFGQYMGTPMDFGRMDTTISDPSVQAQFAWRVGIPNAGQLNALETMNIRGERSVTCKGAYDAHPSSGPLPAGAPLGCEAFRQLPDALERAAELDAQYRNHPDLKKLPLYCIPFSFKNWYEAKDMRSTGGNDVNFAMDVPPEDSDPVALVRKKGAISYAIAGASQNRITLSATPSGVPAAKVIPSDAQELSTWSGQACNPYDTEREARGTSSGSGVSVSANLVACSICEQTAGSCQGPASRNNLVLLLNTKGLFADGGIFARNQNDRAGIHCRTVGDAALVLDAIKGYDSREYYTAIPISLIPTKPYASFVVNEKDLKGKKGKNALEGMRIALAREFFVKHVPNDVAISDKINDEVKSVLRGKLGAELVESVDPLYPDDPDVPNMKYTFQDAFAEIMPRDVPEYFSRTTSTGELEFAVPDFDVTTKDYLVKLALGEAPLSDNLNLRNVRTGLDNTGRGAFNTAIYLAERGDKRVFDWASWVANEKPGTDSNRRSAENAVDEQDLRATRGIDRIKMQNVMRLVILKVMYENDIDAFVNPETTLPPRKIGGPGDPTINGRQPSSPSQGFTALMGTPQIVVPAITKSSTSRSLF